MNDVEERIRRAFEPYRYTNVDRVPSSGGEPERAKSGPISLEEPIPPVRTSLRLVTAITALALFAFVVVVFVVPALRLNDDTGTLPSSGPLLPLWPVQTADELQRYQTQADAGQHPEALDPHAVAEAFGHRVLGWDHLFVVLHTDPISELCGAAVPGNAAPDFATGCWSPGLPGQYPGIEDQSGIHPHRCRPSLCSHAIPARAI